MKQFKIVPISAVYAKNIRDTRKDDFGHEVVEQIATGHGPCRVSLKPFQPGKDKRLLFSHSPFAMDNAFNQPDLSLFFRMKWKNIVTSIVSLLKSELIRSIFI